jgi:large subunit ribosomal protein L9
MAQNVSVILARDVANLGRVGELVNVRPGYARNYLVPTGLALPASPKRVAFFEHQKKVIEHKRRLLRGESEKKAKEMSGVQVTLSVKVGEQGKIFGAITARDISRALTAQGHPIHHKDIKLAEPIKSVGIHNVDVRLEADVNAQVKVIVAAEIVAEEAQATQSVDDLPSFAAPEAKEEAAPTAPAGEA